MTGEFLAQINWCERFFKHLSLFEEKIDKPAALPAPLATLRKLNYRETWKLYIANGSYNIQLNDSSILYFIYTSSKDFSFGYYQCPYEIVTYKEFLIEQGFTYNEVGDDFRSDYTEFLEQATVRETPISFRYDYKPETYNEGLHPASHMHIGFDSNIRIGFDCIIDPQSFVLLITRQCYPKEWFDLISGNEKFKMYEKLLESYKRNLTKIENKFLKRKDSFEHYLL